MSVRSRWFKRAAVAAFVVAVGAFLAAPMLVVVPMSFSGGERLRFPPDGLSFRWYNEVLSSDAWLDATVASAKVALVSGVLATLLGTLVAFGLDRSRWRGKPVIQALLMLPVVAPQIVIAIGVFDVYGQWGLHGDWIGLVIVHTCMSVPVVALIVGSALKSLDPDLALAAAGMGARPLTVFRRITLPIIAPAVAASAFFAVILSWDEVVIAQFMTSPRFQTLPSMVWTQVRGTLDPSVAVAATLLLAATTLMLILGALLRRPSAESR